MLLPNRGTTFDKVGRFAAIAVGFTMPISTAADNILLGIVAACFVAAGRYRECYAAIRTNPVFIASLALFGAFVAAAFYSQATAYEAALHLLKYSDLLFIPIIAAFFHDAATRRMGLYAFSAAIAFTLLLSFALHSGGLPRSGLFVQNFAYPVVFKHSLTHTIMMALGAFLFVQLAVAAATRSLRAFWYVLAGAAVVNIVFLVPGRTGYIILCVLGLYIGYRSRRWPGFAMACAAIVLAIGLAYAGSFPFRERVDKAIEEYASWKPDAATSATSAVGSRLEFYRNSLEIVRDHPLVGVGTGGFPRAYAEQVKGADMLATSNPHNEYLLVAVQTGMIGLLLLLYLFWQQWRLAPRLASPLETDLARGLVLTIAIGCLFNSLLLDHAEGLLYAWLTALLYAGLQSPVSSKR